MEVEKRQSSESSADEEGDRLAVYLKEEEDEDGVKRSYGCMFCKRGFTNAQALGGHMNIHRKDRVKGKGHLHLLDQVPVSCSNDGKKVTLSDVVNSLIDPEPVGGERSYPMSQQASQLQRSISDQKKLLQTLAMSPVSPKHKRRFMESDFSVRIPKSLGRTGRGFLDDGLSLHIGLSASPDCKAPKICHKETKIDLELRLGRGP